jgi:hypothetical protein
VVSAEIGLAAAVDPKPVSSWLMSTRSIHYPSLKFILFLAIPCLLAFFSIKVEAADVILGWDANDEPDLAGYVLYGSEGSKGPPWDEIGTYPEEQLPDPLNPMVTVTDLKTDTVYYFAVSAYDIDDNESGFSKSVCVENGAACQNDALDATAVSSGDGGGGGGGCFLTASASGLHDVGGHTPLILLALVLIGLAFFRKN